VYFGYGSVKIVVMLQLFSKSVAAGLVL